MGSSAQSRLAASAPRLPERYRPVRPIAAGGSAIVWCAEDELLGRRVAVKLLADPYAADPAAVRRFQREARAAAQLSGHPHVVTIFDVGETLGDGEFADRRPFIVMEHLAGGTVGDAVRLREYDLEDAVRWLHEAAGAIDYAHRRGILHRDIKLANLLLDRRRTLHVADFGIAQIAGEDTMAGSRQVLGTASYLAPERIAGRPATVASDIYSLAVAAFELFTRERPFTASSYLAQAKQHLEEEPPAVSVRRPELPRALDAIIARGMAKAPEDRWPSAEAFSDAVGQVLATVIPALPAGPSGPAAVDDRRAALDDRRAAVARARRAVAAAPPASLAATRVLTPTHPRSRRHRRGVALGVTCVTAVAVGLAVAAGGGVGSSSHARARHLAAATGTSPHTAAVIRPAHRAAPVRHASPSPAATSSTTSTSATTPTTTTPTTPTPAPASGATALEVRGHGLLQGGSAAAAIPVLQQAVAAATPGSLTYAYALFDLGSALRQAGQARAAVRVLYARLQIPNQTGKVRAELALALRALGQQAGGGGGAGGPSSPAAPAGDHGSSAPPGPTADAGLATGASGD